MGSCSGPRNGGSCSEEEEEKDGNGFWQQGRQSTTADGASCIARLGFHIIGSSLPDKNVFTSGVAGSDSSLDSKDQAAASEVTSTMQNGGRELESKVQMLYIQMEFCPRTLKQVLDQGAIDPADAWQVPTGHGCLTNWAGFPGWPACKST